MLDAATLAWAANATGRIVIAANTGVPDGTLRTIERLTTADAHWYAVDGAPQLPVLCLRFDDPGRTWLYLDPNTSAVLERLDRRRHTYRWLFDLLHKWDLNLLTTRRPAWDLVLWALSVLGLITSVNGVWLSWRRLSRRRIKVSE